MEAALQPFLAALTEFHQSGKLTDFTIVSNGREWPFHRLIISLHSRVLAKACDGDFKEAKDRLLDLSEDDADCVNAMVNFMYHFDYKDEILLAHRDCSLLVFHVKVCFLADKYDDIADAASYAYEAAGATGDIRDTIVNHGIQNKLLPSDEGTAELVKTMETYPIFAVDYALALEARTRKGW